jgi:hypothetical protein
MNAYELADINDWSCCAHVKEVSAMLRQQADRIAHLEMLVANRNEIIDKLDLTMTQIKELSDEEIKECADSVCHAWKKNGVGELYMGDFARAILKKASEK